jgi:hypothetical protein
VRYQAFWISPSGAVTPAEGGHHIFSVVASPEKFGYTKEELLSRYEKHGEPFGKEGKAREEIMVELMKRNWIRLRYIPRADVWTAQLSRYTDRQKGFLFDWTQNMMEGKYGDKVGMHTELKVISDRGDILFHGTFYTAGKMFYESVSRHKTELMNIREVILGEEERPTVLSIDIESAKEMYNSAKEVAKAAKGSFGAIVMAAMLESRATEFSKIAKAFPNIFSTFKLVEHLEEDNEL